MLDACLRYWAHRHRAQGTDEECHVWNRFIAKLGWSDEQAAARFIGQDGQEIIAHKRWS
jgi:hypothetical protein